MISDYRGTTLVCVNTLTNHYANVSHANYDIGSCDALSKVVSTLENCITASCTVRDAGFVLVYVFIHI